MYQDLSFLITSSDNKVILNNTTASKKYRSISLHTDMGDFLCAEAKSIVSSLPADSSAIVELRKLGKTKFAFVLKKTHFGTPFFTYIFLDTDARDTALLELPADIVCSRVEKEREGLQRELCTPELYLLSIKIKNAVSKQIILGGADTRHFSLSDLISVLESNAKETYLSGCSLCIEYENALIARFDENISLCAFASAILFLLSAVSDISEDKKIVLAIGYFDRTLYFKVTTETSLGTGRVFRDRDIFETDIFDQDLYRALSLCSYFSGAFNGRLSVSLDGTGDKNLIYFEYTVKIYDKRPAGIKVDPELPKA